MGKPAARIGDMHTCPMATPIGSPHVGGPILPPGAPNVLIGGLPAATVGDLCVCAGPPDTISKGSATVFIGAKPAARMGDQTTHGGVITAGNPTVLIGDAAPYSSSMLNMTPAVFYSHPMPPSEDKAVIERKARYSARIQIIASAENTPKQQAAAKRLAFNNDSIIRAEAAQYVYEVDEYNRGIRSSLPLPPIGLKVIDPKTVPGLENAVFTDNESGFGAALFESEINNERMLTYRGTNNAVTGKKDWMTNGTQALGKETAQYNQAMDLAKKIKKIYKADFISVGHSLGGGLASAGVGVTGVKGYTYNSAGLHPNTVSRQGGMTNADAAKLIQTQAVEGEVLTMCQQKGNDALIVGAMGAGTWLAGPLGAAFGYVAGKNLPQIPQALGEMQRLASIQGGNPIDRHGMEQVIEGIEAAKQDDINTLNKM